MNPGTQPNWHPKSHDEFRQAVDAGRVRLSILPDQWDWLRSEVYQPGPWFAVLSAFGLARRSKEMILGMMYDSEDVLWKVHSRGIDLVLD